MDDLYPLIISSPTYYGSEHGTISIYYNRITFLANNSDPRDLTIIRLQPNYQERLIKMNKKSHILIITVDSTRHEFLLQQNFESCIEAAKLLLSPPPPTYTQSPLPVEISQHLTQIQTQPNQVNSPQFVQPQQPQQHQQHQQPQQPLQTQQPQPQQQTQPPNNYLNPIFNPQQQQQAPTQPQNSTFPFNSAPINPPTIQENKPTPPQVLEQPSTSNFGQFNSAVGNSSTQPQLTPQNYNTPPNFTPQYNSTSNNNYLPYSSAPPPNNMSSFSPAPPQAVTSAPLLPTTSSPPFQGGFSTKSAIPRAEPIFLDVSVKDPISEGDIVTYLVSYRTNIKSYHSPSGEVRRRYSEFDKLANTLQNAFGQYTKVLKLPDKSYTRRLDSAFIAQRAIDLHTWLQVVANDEYTQQSLQLAAFLTSPSTIPTKTQEGVFSSFVKSLTDNPIVTNVGDTFNKAYQAVSGGIVGNKPGTDASGIPLSPPSSSRFDYSSGGPQFTSHGLGSNNSASPSLNIPTAGGGMMVSNSSATDRDYLELRKLMASWHLTPKKIPFAKFLTLLLGSTSSGKSAFISSFFGVTVRKSSDHQQDTEFTLVEVIPVDEFYSLAGVKEKVAHVSHRGFLNGDINFVDSNLLTQPINDLESDWRNGRVFIRLSPTQLAARYEQLKSVNKDQGLFRACLINEAALDRTMPHYATAKRTIFIDSPGFSSVQSMEIADKFMGNLAVLQYLYNMCDLLLYMLPCGQISTLASQLPLLELTITYANFGEKVTDDMIKTMFTQQKNQNYGNSDSAGGFFSGLFTSITSSIVKRASELLPSGPSSPSSNPLNANDPKNTYTGSAVWHKTLFVVTKIDSLLRQLPPHSWNRLLLSQTYELGVLFGSALDVLGAPVHDHCLSIGLPDFIPKPMQQENTNPLENPLTGDLSLLFTKIIGRESETPYIDRMETAIQNMCDDLEAAMKNSYLATGHSEVQQIRERSLNRVNRQTRRFG